MWLTFHRILRLLSETNRRKTSRRPCVSSYRPRLEALEDRTLLSAYVVTTTADNGDNTNPIAGSLRDAINQVNAGTYNEIDFNITAASDAAGGGTGFYATTGIATIQPPTALLPITNSVIINGYTQGQGTSLAATPNKLAVGDNAVLKIELRGNSSIATGLELYGSSSNGSTIEGLSINSFGGPFETGSMIDLNASNGDTIQGNFIGLDASGESSPASAPNFSIYIANGGQGGGIQLQDAQNDHIGNNGDGVNDPAERNVISNCWFGVGLETFSSDDIVAGNYIGTDASGTKEIGNWVGISFGHGCSSNQIGTNGTDTDAAGEGNLISGNDAGIVFGNGETGIAAETGGTVEGNMIGPDAYGNKLNGAYGNLSWQGNLQAGIAALELDSGIHIGGSNPVQANIIAYNQGPGVTFLNFLNEYPTQITVQGNSIYDNVGAGIDEGGSYSASTGVTPGPDNASNLSIADGTDTGPNELQHYPPLTSAQAGSSTTTITGSLSTNNAGPYTLDFYDNGNSPDPSGYGQGKTYLGSAIITNTGSFSVILSVATVAGDYLTATATDAAGDTSIFSNDIQAAAPPTGQTFSQNLQAIVDQSSPPSEVTLQTSASLSQDTIISAVNSLTAPSSPVTITLNLNGGTYNDTTVSPPPNVTLIINGASGTNTFVGHSPAFTVTGGNVIVRNVTFSTATDAPTILVTGGSLTLRNDVVQESAGYTDAAISVTGGTLDLGTASDPGGNTLNVNGSGEFVHNTTANLISAVGDTFSANGTAQTASTLSFTALTAGAATALLNQPVSFTATVRPNSTGTPSGSVDFVDTTTNTDLGSVALSGGTATLTTTTLNAGNHVIQARYSGDGTFLASLDTIAVVVHYKFSGFLPPLSNLPSFGVNRTIPIKFQLTDSNGKAITSLSAVASLQIQALDANGNPVGAPFNPTSTNNQDLQYSGGQYQFNWQTKGLAAGSYQIVLKLADGATQTKTVQLTAGGSSAGLVSDGSGGTATAGALLGGEVDLYVDTSNGELASDELGRIQDAVNSVDATIAPYGVVINEVTDPTQANVTLNMNTTSSLGGVAQGVLGCTTDADQVTMIQGWNWYAGSDATLVGAGQYDFETAVVHELGHVLGLGHSNSSTSVMYASLATGTANRVLTTADLNIPASDSGPCALLAGPAAPVSAPTNVPGMTVPSRGSPISSVNPLSAELTGLLSNAWNAYQSNLSSLSALRQTVDALALQRLDALWSVEAGAMGMSKDTLMRDLFLASMTARNGL